MGKDQMTSSTVMSIFFYPIVPFLVLDRYFLVPVIPSYLAQWICTTKRGSKYSRIHNIEDILLNGILSVTNA
jgi:hypothetical protein